MTALNGFDTTVAPSGPGCADCDPETGWWLHLRRCAQCGHVGCCDSSPSQHATAHFRTTGHPIIQSYEPGETWLWDYETDGFVDGPALEPPLHHPQGQPTPGPEGNVPANWEELLH